MKRVRQLAYVSSHPVDHRRCYAVIRDSGLVADRLTPLKYVGAHLALSLSVSERRQALAWHYDLLPRLLRPGLERELHNGMLIWQKEVGDDSPPLSIYLEPSRLAPMEGELQLRFCFKSDLCVLTFLLAPGRIFDAGTTNALFVGGLQGRFASRDELREACRLNDEISPATLLILAVQAITKITRIGALVAISDEDHISRSYSTFKFDYAGMWCDAGATQIGRYYRLPLETPQKPLATVQRSHRSRARRRREAKTAIREKIESRLCQLITPLEPSKASPKLREEYQETLRQLTNDPNRKQLTPHLT